MDDARAALVGDVHRHDHVLRAALPHLRRAGGSVVAVGARAAETGA